MIRSTVKLEKSNLLYSLTTGHDSFAADREICEWLTERENHRYLSEKEASIVIKRFLFEAFDCYIALFYIAFYELDVAKLRSELVSLYTVDSIRRVATESVLPFLIERFNDYRRSANLAAAKKDDDIKVSSVVSGGEDEEIDPREIEHVVAEILRDEHEAFDEYLEMVIELGQCLHLVRRSKKSFPPHIQCIFAGYVTLFAAAFPLAAPLSLVCNMIELRSDAFKLTYACRRPRALAARDTGPWEVIMTCIIWLSAITNVLVMGVTSEQLKEVFPSFFDDHGETHDPKKAGVVLLVILEHALLAAGLAITFGFRTVSRGFVVDFFLLISFFLSFDLYLYLIFCTFI